MRGIASSDLSRLKRRERGFCEKSPAQLIEDIDALEREVQQSTSPLSAMGVGVEAIVMFGWDEPDGYGIMLSYDWLDRYGLRRYSLHGSAAYGLPCNLNFQTGAIDFSIERRRVVEQGHAAFCAEFGNSPPLGFFAMVTGDIDGTDYAQYGRNIPESSASDDDP
jgi:hypothetical protein